MVRVLERSSNLFAIPLTEGGGENKEEEKCCLRALEEEDPYFPPFPTNRLPLISGR